MIDIELQETNMEIKSKVHKLKKEKRIQLIDLAYMHKIEMSKIEFWGFHERRMLEKNHNLQM